MTIVKTIFVCIDCGETKNLRRNICNRCAYKRKQVLNAQRVEDLLSGKVEWACQVCATTDPDLYNPRESTTLCRKCFNDSKNRKARQVPVVPVKSLDKDAFTHKVLPPSGRVLWKINQLATERATLWRLQDGKWTEERNNRIDIITKHLPTLYDLLRRARCAEIYAHGKRPDLSMPDQQQARGLYI